MDKDTREIMKRIGAAIYETLNESERIQKLIVEMEGKGLNISLSLAIMVGIGDESKSKKGPRQTSSSKSQGPCRSTMFDRRFLKALRIRNLEE